MVGVRAKYFTAPSTLAWYVRLAQRLCRVIVVSILKILIFTLEVILKQLRQGKIHVMISNLAYIMSQTRRMLLLITFPYRIYINTTERFLDWGAWQAKNKQTNKEPTHLQAGVLLLCWQAKKKSAHLKAGVLHGSSHQTYCLFGTISKRFFFLHKKFRGYMHPPGVYEPQKRLDSIFLPVLQHPRLPGAWINKQEYHNRISVIIVNY